MLVSTIGGYLKFTHYASTEIDQLVVQFPSAINLIVWSDKSATIAIVETLLWRLFQCDSLGNFCQMEKFDIACQNTKKNPRDLLHFFQYDLSGWFLLVIAQSVNTSKVSLLEMIWQPNFPLYVRSLCGHW